MCRSSQSISPSPSQSLRGATMVEALVAVSVGAVVLALGVGMIHVLLGGERETRRTLESSIRLSRLSTIVRRDVHAAQSAAIADEPGGGPARLILRFPERRTVTYVAEGPSLGRVDNNPSTGGNRDSFRFPAGTTIRLERSGASELVRIEIDQRNRPNVSNSGQHAARAAATRSRRIVHIDALPARDRRYALRQR